MAGKPSKADRIWWAIKLDCGKLSPSGFNLWHSDAGDWAPIMVFRDAKHASWEMGEAEEACKSAHPVRIRVVPATKGGAWALLWHKGTRRAYYDYCYDGHEIALYQTKQKAEEALKGFDEPLQKDGTILRVRVIQVDEEGNEVVHRPRRRICLAHLQLTGQFGVFKRTKKGWQGPLDYSFDRHRSYKKAAASLDAYRRGKVVGHSSKAEYVLMEMCFVPTRDEGEDPDDNL